MDFRDFRSTGQRRPQRTLHTNAEQHGGHVEWRAVHRQAGRICVYARDNQHDRVICVAFSPFFFEKLR
jgi:hypothetical protein